MQSRYTDALVTAVRLLKNIPEHHEISLGNWECLSSPTKKCAYDLTDENRLGEDECIFCGHPDERK
jgi:hypothetical protein